MSTVRVFALSRDSGRGGEANPADFEGPATAASNTNQVRGLHSPRTPGPEALICSLVLGSTLRRPRHGSKRCQQLMYCWNISVCCVRRRELSRVLARAGLCHNSLSVLNTEKDRPLSYVFHINSIINYTDSYQ